MGNYGRYIAYEASPKMYQLAERFLVEMANKNPKPQADLLLDIIDCYIPESLEAYLMRPSEIVRLGPTAQKIVKLCASTISKTAHSLTRHILKKVKNRDLNELTDFIDGMMLREDDTEKNVGLAAVPISPYLFDQINEGIDNIRTGVPMDYRDDVIEILLQVADQVSKHLMMTPLEILPIGPILKKMAYVGMDTAMAAVNKVIRQVFGKLDNPQLLEAADYFESLLVTSAKSNVLTDQKMVTQVS